MSTPKSLRTLKFILPLLALVFTIGIAFAFTKKQPDAKPDTMTTLHFKYQLTSYDESQVEARGNWERIDAEEACEQEQNEAACSFAIEVPEADEALYLNGTQPSSLVLIEAAASSGTSYYVEDVKKNVPTPPSIASSIENIIP